MNICLGALPHFAEDLPMIGKLLGRTQVQTIARHAILLLAAGKVSDFSASVVAGAGN